MATTIDYYFSLNSPWTYLGHDRLAAMAAEHGKQVRMLAVDFSIVFPATGGLPLPKRAPARQAYRLTELQRWRNFVGIELNLHPAHWPADEVNAIGMVMALAERATAPDSEAMRLAGAFMRAVWAEEKNIGDRDTILAIAKETGVDGPALLEMAAGVAAGREANSVAAVERGVFGAPSYIYA
ncbi:MAG: 2-hydroxychromene-2-carboxylate isomerase, partial [Gammaproteobacteria bacterium]